MQIQKDLKKMASKKVAKQSQYYFKTGKGEYGYGDIFLGIKMPELRQLAKKYIEINLGNVKKLIKSKYHEERLVGLIILVNKYTKADTGKDKEKIYQLYISHFKYINNWDLVDVTCPQIIGRHLAEGDRKILYVWAKSDHLWTKRIAVVTNWWFIRSGDLKDIFKIAKILIGDEHDLIHKAVGWMLREAGKKDLKLTENFLKEYYMRMPRTMLRYAIERFPEVKRQKYLKGKI